MESFLTDARALAGKIRQSSFHAEYMSAKAVIEQNPEYVRLINDYRSLRLSAVTAAGGEPVCIERQRQISAAYYGLTANDEIRRFMDAERALLSVTGGVIDIITAECELL